MSRNESLQVNIYWSSLLQKWVGEVRCLEMHDLCMFYVESDMECEALLKVGGYLIEAARKSFETKVD